MTPAKLTPAKSEQPPVFRGLSIRAFMESADTDVYACVTMPVVNERIVVIKDSVSKESFPLRQFVIYHEKEVAWVARQVQEKPKPEARQLIEKAHALIKNFEGTLELREAESMTPDGMQESIYWKRLALYLKEQSQDALLALCILFKRGVEIEFMESKARFSFPSSISDVDCAWLTERYLAPFICEFQAALLSLSPSPPNSSNHSNTDAKTTA